MAFTPLTKDQYDKAVSAGFTPDQIIANEKIRKQKSTSDDSSTTSGGGDFLDKAENIVGNIFPGRQVGRAIGTLAGYGATAAGDLLSGTNNAANYDLSAPSPLQIGGDIVKGAALVGGLKAPLPTAATLPAAIGKTAAQFGLLGAATGAGEAATNTSGKVIPTGDDLKQIASKAFWSGLTSAAVGGVAGAVGYGLNKLISAGPEKLYNNALNVSNKIKAAGKSPADFLADEGVWGNLGTMSRAAEQGIADEGDVIAQKVAGSTAQGTLSEIRQDAIDRLASKFGNLYSDAKLGQLVDSVPMDALTKAPDGTFDMTTLNQTRQQLGKLVGDTKWLQTNPTENTSAAQAVYRAMADKLQSTTDTADEFARQSQWIEAKKAIGKALLAADKKWLPGFYDWTSGAVGSILGMFGGNPIAGGLAGIAVERAARSPAVLTGAAQLLNNAPQALAPALGKAAQTLGTQIPGRIIGQ